MSCRVVRDIRVAVLAALSGLALALALAVPAQAAPEFSEFSGLTANSDGSSSTVAGAHPHELITDTQFELVQVSGGSMGAKGGPLKEIAVDLPPGVIGNPLSAPRCPLQELMAPGSNLECEGSTQVGFVVVSFKGSPGLPLAIFNMVPPKGVAAQFAFNLFGVPTFLNSTVRSGSDYGVTVSSQGISQGNTPVTGAKVTVWGTPASAAHDPERGFCLATPDPEDRCPSDAPPIPLLSNPTVCDSGPLTTIGRARTYFDPDVFAVASFDHDTNGNPVEYEECDRVPFDASMRVAGVSKAADSPSGLEVNLSIDQTGMLSPGGISPSPLKSAKVTLPAGMALNTSSAAGLSGCSPAQIGLSDGDSAKCPESSKIGSVEVESPAVEGVLPGDVYLATQSNNPFNSLAALYIAIEDPESGIVVKLPGKVDLDPSTGQVTTSFEDNPQLPLAALRLRLKSGPRAPLTAPRDCGTYAIATELRSWARPDKAVLESSSFTIDQDCEGASKFKPGFEAGTTNPIAGAFSPFLLRITRSDAEQNLARIEATLPEGALAKLAGVALCAESEAATGNCPAASQVGSATVGSGSGPSPLYVPQPGRPTPAVFLAGPYKGAPYSLLARVPAQAGPFDLGTVVVRNTIEIDPVTARASVASDPLPQILQGIPVSYRDVRVSIDRPQFTLNPTSCNPKAVAGTLTSDRAIKAQVSSRFQVADCERLAFKPKLALKLSGKTNRSAHPALRATLTMPKGGANVARAAVTLPKTEFLEQSHIRTICTRVQYAAGEGGGRACPKASVYGYAKAWSPLLDKPLEGPVYLRSSNNPLPDLVASLDGQIHIDLSGRIDTKNARIRNTFDLVPDAPVSKFVLTMQGGRKGLLVNNTELCKAKPGADVKFDGQNGKTADSQVSVKADCGKKGKKRKK